MFPPAKQPLPFETASDRLQHAIAQHKAAQAAKNAPKIVWVNGKAQLAS